MAMMNPREIAEWDALVERLFALDKEEPWLAQTIEDDVPGDDIETLGSATSGNHGHEGRPGKVGGSGPGGWTDAGGFAHTGIEWKQEVDANGRPIPIRCDTVEEAAQLVLEGKVVEVKDVATAYTLISRLAEMHKEGKEYDLCNVSVKGTNLFCAESLRTKEFPNGIPRVEMPQLGGKPVPGSEADKLPRNKWDKTEVDGAASFVTYLQGIGMKTETGGAMAASALKASQMEMIGSKVNKMIHDTSFDPGNNPIFISSDNYVVDGHHRWAAIVGRDAADGTLNGDRINVTRINAPISEVLHIANVWASKFGIQQTAGVKKQAKDTGLVTHHHTPVAPI